MSENEENGGGEPEKREKEPFPTLSRMEWPEEIGTQVGPYKLLSVLGEGGFGIVYLAEQREPIRRQVALKVIKPGMDSKQVIARFEAERQALAVLDHPNIAHVFDAGATENGRPYFVMELVKGLPITEYCDEKRLSIEERLELFRQVCEAVQHAHQKGIIHRDIKPSNILVPVQSGKPVPMIIDFGVAKAISQPLTERTLFTEQGQFIGTPEYMSPEQAGMTILDIDTRSDIYSLGVVLYELLTGTLPFSHDELGRAGFAEIQRIIRETDPPRPSTRLSSLGEEAKKIAEKRHTEVAVLTKRLHKELEWIPLKAMRKEQDRRYKTASELADDVRNYLDGGPLIAGPESAGYRLKKVIKRQRALVAGVTAVLIVLIAGIVVSTYFAIQSRIAEEKERNQRIVAEKARGRAEKAETDAVEAQMLAEQRESDARQHLYMARIGLVQQAWQNSNVAEVSDLLNLLRPEVGQEDLRAFEWYYFWEQCHSRHTTLYGHPSEIRAVSFSPCGKTLATSTAGYNTAIRLWDIQGHRVKNVLRGRTRMDMVMSLVFSPDGKTLASGDWNKTLRLWDTATGQEYPNSMKMSSIITSVAFSPDGKVLAAGLMGGGVRLWDLDDSLREILDNIKHPSAGVYVAFSPNPNDAVLAIAWGEYGKPSSVTLWDIRTSRVRATLTGHADTIESVAFSPDGKLLATASRDTTVRLWDLSSDHEAAVGRGHTAPLWCVAFNPDGKSIATGSSDNTIRLWDLTDTKDLREIDCLLGHTDRMWALSFSPDGKLLASGSRDQLVKLWKVDESLEPMLHGSAVSSVAFCLDDTVLAAGCESGDVVLWEVTGRQELRRLQGHIGPVWSVAVSPGSNRVATGGKDKTVRLWDPATGDSLATLRGHTDEVYSVTFSPDGGTLAVTCKDMSLTLWDLATQEQRTIQDRQDKPWNRDIMPVLSAAFSPDGKVLATGGWDGTAQLWDVSAGSKGNTLGQRWVDEGTWSVTFSPISAIFAIAKLDKTLELWDPTTKTLNTTLSGHTGPVWCLAFSPDERLIASGSTDTTVRLWDVDLGTQRATLIGHEGPVTSVAFSSDGNILVSSSKDGSVRLWQAATESKAEEHPDTAEFFRDKANLSHQRGEREHAILYQEKALSIYRSTLGEGSVVTHEAMLDLAYYLITSKERESLKKSQSLAFRATDFLSEVDAMGNWRRRARVTFQHLFRNNMLNESERRAVSERLISLTPANQLNISVRRQQK